MAGVVHIPWYATGLRGDKLEAALAEISPVALRYGATSHAVYRYRDDKYKFLQTAEFENKSDFEAYWYGPEFTDMRVITSSWYTVPLLYAWTTLVTSGTLAGEPLARSATGTGQPGGDLVG
jgi:hypothetical protein